jgi:hypothetical protein
MPCRSDGKGGLTKAVAKELDRLLSRALGEASVKGTPVKGNRAAAPPPRTGTILAREWQDALHHVTIMNDGPQSASSSTPPARWAS